MSSRSSVDLDTKAVVVSGTDLVTGDVVAAIDEAGYDAIVYS